MWLRKFGGDSLCLYLCNYVIFHTCGCELRPGKESLTRSCFQKLKSTIYAAEARPSVMQN
ncbi:hypothetical protein GLYMA_13G169400v4 [Glycine max]|uniref:Uncharacterized protein n=1 Tax=Glycine max TaxID=3847 RepID=A0A0R0GQ12_SOYBN|nr:hypothetical protein JHK87_036452 [Glycine soja]KAG4970842.1 hypothetical protein JHK85_037263 [Glycine max]KAG4977241.1 hypothetical protein JHK86_036715 [Glycine max]KAG5130544.1 hypothetical protein JHK84_036941 [Glycine max]KAH1101960.1 hypothetical protein GYH30_036484 [Glycine max]